MTLRIAHVLNNPGRGGVPRVAHALVRHLDPERFANHLFYLKPGDGADLFDDIDIPRRVATSASKATAMVELVAWLDMHRIDILHTHSFRPNLYARMAGAVLRPTGLRIAAHYHNEYADKWNPETLALERRLAAITDAGLAVSRPVACQVSEVTGLVPAVLENGIDLSRVTGGDRTAGRASLGLPPHALVVGLIGRICVQKGIDTFVEAAIRLCPRLPQVHFVVVGDAEDRDIARAVCQSIEAAGYADRIVLRDHREEIADTYAALDLLVAPSRWEGFGLVAAEAMAAGVPVIASAVGGLPTVVGDAGRLLSAMGPETLATEIEGLLGDEDRRKLLITAGKVQSTRFDWETSADRLGGIYAGLQR